MYVKRMFLAQKWAWLAKMRRRASAPNLMNPPLQITTSATGCWLCEWLMYTCSGLQVFRGMVPTGYRRALSLFICSVIINVHFFIVLLHLYISEQHCKLSHLTCSFYSAKVITSNVIFYCIEGTTFFTKSNLTVMHKQGTATKFVEILKLNTQVN